MNLLEIKESLQYDEGFRNLFPEYKSEIKQFLKDTSCPCNAKLYKKIAIQKDKISDYKSGIIVPIKTVADEFKVINTNIESLESELKKIPVGSKVESMARYDSNITIIVRIPR